ncbi:hypothetical protein D3C75_1159900 [compost metagenome]
MPVGDNRPLPLVVQAGGRRLQDRFPRLGQRLDKHRLPEAGPLFAETGRHQAAVGLRVGEVHTFTLKDRLGQLLHHRLRIGGVSHLLEFEPHAGDPGEIRLQAERTVCGHQVLGAVFTHQRE